MKKFVPNHVAIVMDGNRRWAKKQSLVFSKGHEAGAKNINRICLAAIKIGIKKLSLFAFSTENLKRSNVEIEFLKQCMHKIISSEKSLDYIMSNNIKLKAFGDISAFDKEMANSISKIENLSKNNSGLVLQIHINYGSKNHIAQSAFNLAKSNISINEKSLNDEIIKSGAGNVDLLIRTGSELRLSNFLIWECAYAEMYFSDKMWPDFSPEDLEKAVSDYALRDRRYGE